MHLADLKRLVAELVVGRTLSDSHQDDAELGPAGIKTEFSQ